MNKFLKFLLIGLAAVLLAALGFGTYLFVLARGAKFDENKLVKNERSVDFFSASGEAIERGGDRYTPLSEMTDELKNAFIAVEDKRFYSHRGVDYRRMAGAALKNLSTLSFREGASTISQQLIKNTHLTGEKTLKRKVCEVRLARKLEKTHTKDQILECYLNTICFGNGAFGVGAAADLFFSKKPADLTANECAMLAATVKAPARYSPLADPEKCAERKDLVLRLMFEQGLLAKEAFDEAVGQPVAVAKRTDENKNEAYLRLAEKELEELERTHLFGGIRGGYRVYTYLDEHVHSLLAAKGDLFDGADDYAEIVLDNATGGVAAYAGTVGEIKRSPGSTIKPPLVYAPALEDGAIAPLTPLLDEKTDFGGYSPSNYRGKYYGYVSAKFALANSLNVPAVRTLSYIGVERAVRQAKAVGIPLEKDDETLALALGGLTSGVTLREIAAAYRPFAAQGNYVPTAFIRRITDASGKTVYERTARKTSALSPETAFLMNDILLETTAKGTMKSFTNLGFPVAGKSGTVGTADGNTDAYAVTYNPDYTAAFWLGKERGGNMTVAATGGGYPTAYLAELWKNIYRERSAPNFPAAPVGVVECALDRREYEERHRLVLAGDLPQHEILKGYFRAGTEPKEYSDRFTRPTIEKAEIQVKDGDVIITLCLEEYYDYRIYREDDGEKIAIFDSSTDGNKREIVDRGLKTGARYRYTAVPYLLLRGEEKCGEETEIGVVRLARPPEPKGEWWKDDFD